jgi:cell division protein FtsQ
MAGRGNLELRTLHLSRKIREFSCFLRQCFLELTGRANRQTVRNSDLRQHSFATTPEPARGKRKRLSLKQVRSRIQQKRRMRSESYETRPQKYFYGLKYLPPALIIVALAVYLFTGGGRQIGGMFNGISLFKVKTLEFSGCESASDERLRLLTGINLYQTSLLGLDQETVAANVERDPWVSKAVVKRNWPSGILIEVVEHRPVAMINRNTKDDPKLYYVDKTGTAFLEVAPGQDVDYPVITGLDRFTAEAERAAIFSDIYIFLRLAGRNDPNLPAQSVSEIHVNEAGEMVIYLVDHTFPIFFGKGQIAEKYSRLVKVLDALYKEKKKGMLISGVEYIRMDYLNDKVLVAQSESG